MLRAGYPAGLLIISHYKNRQKCCQNVQDNPEYNSILPPRTILKLFAVNVVPQIGSDKIG